MQPENNSLKNQIARFLGKIGVFLALALLLPAIGFVGPASAQPDQKTNIITLPWSDPAKKPIPPPFILPKQSRWGCLSCHSNPRLSKLENGKEVSLFIDPNIIGNSMHAQIACLDCHTNFSYDTHPASTPQDFRKVAGLACMKCHPYQADQYRNSVHGKLALQNKMGSLNGREVAPPTCFDCHGNHNIQSPRFEPFRSKFRASVRSGKVCAKCHQDRYLSWNDYYHGRAYKNGAKDAPVCWDCHSNHSILPAKNPDSTVNSENLPKTCGKCHDHPTSVFTSYAGLIHGRAKIVGENPIVRLVRAIFPGSKGANTAAKKVSTSTGGQESESLITRIIRFFFPSSLRPEKP